MSEHKEFEFKDTLNLPKTTLAMRANAAVRELEIQDFWEMGRIYEKNLAQRSIENKFVLHDGPPYLSSPKIHIGTALNKILKDILTKYKAQSGFYAPYVPGYDGHGLPIENAVVKTIEGGREAISKYLLRLKCREFALRNLHGQEEDFRRLGVWGDWEHPYVTISPEIEAEQVRIFGEMYQKGYIEKGLKPVYWCPHCETALAEAEVEYADHTSTAIYVKFEFVEKDAEKIKELAGIQTDYPIYALIWTTTPWTIPSNLAISLNARYEYSLVQYADDIYVIATDLVDAFVKDNQFEPEDVKILGSVKGRDIENFNTMHPLYDRKSPIILGDHVTLDAGTGCVHTAPGHGLEDWEVCQRYDIEVLSPLDAKGIWTDEVPDLEGVTYEDGNKIVIERLDKCGALLSHKQITHSYPHCWRCKHPVIYRATPQWFVKVDRFRNAALREISNVQWIPASGEQRISNMVESRSDWCISRQRVWGVPIPVFYCKDCGEPIVTPATIENLAKIFEKETSDIWVKEGAKYLLPTAFKCPHCGSRSFLKEKDIMDVWFDSGITHRAVVEKRHKELGHLPVEMYLEGSDQHRGWFQSSLLTAVATSGRAPYMTVLTHGFVLDGEGKKMSKSLGNTIAPQDIIKVYGADVLRLWAASVDYRNDVRISENAIKQMVEIFKKMRNTSRFLLGNLYDFDPTADYVYYKDLKAIDKFALHKLNTFIGNVTEAFENYEFYKYFQHLQNFAAADLSSFYLDIVKDRLYTAGKKSLSRRACQTVLYEISQALTRMLAPVMPHQAEDIWQNMPEKHRDGIESVLLTNWPTTNVKWANDKLEAEFTKILKLREIVTKAIEPLRADKQVGSSLEVAVYVQGGDPELLKKYESELANIFITSQAELVDKAPEHVLNEYKEDDYTIYVTEAHGEKCERCWKYRKLIQVGNHGEICQDCINAINGKE
mgnify:FL=1